MLPLVDYLQFAGTSEGAQKGWENRARRFDKVANKHGYTNQGGTTENGSRKYQHSNGKEGLFVNLDTGGWQHNYKDSQNQWAAYKGYGKDTLDKYLGSGNTHESVFDYHQRKIADADAKMPEAIRNVMSPPRK